MLVSNNVAGVVLGHLEWTPRKPLVDRLRDTQIPTVSLDAGDELPGAGVNRQDAFLRLARAAIRAGHRRIGYLDTGFHYSTASARLDGIQQAIAECGHNVELVSFRPFATEDRSTPPEGSTSGLAFEIGQMGAHLFLEKDDRPSAVICYADDAAIAFMSQVQAAGVKVPDDVAVFGFDGVPAGNFSHPSLTTVAQPIEELSNEVVTRLIDLLEKPTQACRDYVLLLGPLIIRESSGPIPEYVGVSDATRHKSESNGSTTQKAANR